MTVGNVTVTAGANATVPGNTNFPILESDEGNIPGVVPMYAPDGTTAPTVLADENGVFVQGDATLVGVNGDTASKGTVNDTATSTTIIPSNADRVGWCIHNTSTVDLYIEWGGTASATNNVATIEAGEYLRDAGLGIYTGDITGVWASDPGTGVAVWREW